MNRADIEAVDAAATARHAHHEAGHAVAAVALGGELIDVFVGSVDWSDGTGAGDMPGGTIHRIETALQPFVTYAGPWAEAKWTAEAEDCDMADALDMAWFNNGDGDGEKYAQRPLTVGQQLDWDVVLESLWPAMCAVADLLVAGQPVTHADVKAALNPKH